MWMLPTWIESLVLSAALSRLGAIQVPVIPVYRQRRSGSSRGRPRAPLLLVPGVWRGTDYVDLAIERHGHHGRSSDGDRQSTMLPDGDPATLPPPPVPPSRTDLRGSSTHRDDVRSRRAQDIRRHHRRVVSGMIEPWRLTTTT
jgi:hypothetical protein